MGIEPTYSAWEADVLPLNYTRVGKGFYDVSCVREAAVKLAGRGNLPSPLAPLPGGEGNW